MILIIFLLKKLRKKQAKKSFLYYLDVYPQGFNSIESRFTLAEIYSEEENFNEALNYYNQIIDLGSNDYREEALVKASKILINDLLLEDAVVLLEELNDVAVFSENKSYSLFNLMRVYYQLNEFVKALDLSLIHISEPTRLLSIWYSLIML